LAIDVSVGSTIDSIIDSTIAIGITRQEAMA
jgi:hypothetical protein